MMGAQSVNREDRSKMSTPEDRPHVTTNSWNETLGLVIDEVTGNKKGIENAQM